MGRWQDVTDSEDLFPPHLRSCTVTLLPAASSSMHFILCCRNCPMRCLIQGLVVCSVVRWKEHWALVDGRVADYLMVEGPSLCTLLCALPLQTVKKIHSKQIQTCDEKKKKSETLRDQQTNRKQEGRKKEAKGGW